MAKAHSIGEWRGWDLRSLVPNPVFVPALPENRVRSVLFNVLLFSAGWQAIEKTCKDEYH